jgi:alpha-glucosidase
MADFDRLMTEAKKRKIRILMDYVANHTSDQHPWFIESRSSRTSPKRDWYIWRDGKGPGQPPNNWQSWFGHSAWTYDSKTGQWYYHYFYVQQPDLNWRNPEVRKAMYDVLRFWLDRGIDGFRIDVLAKLLKDEQFRDNPVNPQWKPGDRPGARQLSRYTQDLPGIHEIVREMRAVVNRYGERVLIGELYLPMKHVVQYYGEQLDEVHLPFNFQLVTMPTWEAGTIRQVVDAYEGALPTGAWPNWVLGNHDRPRIATRVGREQARTAQMLLLTVRGTPTCYYGDELGMQNVAVPLELMHDPPGKDNPEHSRDPERTPMQWDTSPNAGFCPPSVEPWLPVAADYSTYNVAVEQDDPRSFLTLVHTLLTLRRARPALTVGSQQSIDQPNPACFVYLRQHQDQRCLVALNFSAQDQIVALPGQGQARLLLSTHVDREGPIPLSEVQLRGNEGLLLEVEAPSLPGS